MVAERSKTAIFVWAAGPETADDTPEWSGRTFFCKSVNNFFELLDKWAAFGFDECRSIDGENAWMLDAEAIGLDGIEIHKDSWLPKQLALVLFVVQFLVAKRGWLFTLAYAGDGKYWAKVWATPEASPQPYFAGTVTMALMEAYVETLESNASSLL